MTDSSETHTLPLKPNLEHLRKEAKQRLATLRDASISAQLTEAQLLVARRYGFSSWRAMKQEVERRAASLSADVRTPPPLSVVFRPQAPSNRRQRFSALHDTTELEHSFFRATVMGMGMAQAMTLAAIAFALLR